MTRVEPVANGNDVAPQETDQNGYLLGWGDPNHQPVSTKPGLELTEVSWGLVIHTGNYSSCRLSASASVAPGADPDLTLHLLQEWVDEQAPLSDSDSKRLVQDRRDYDAEMRGLEDRMNTVRRRWDICKAFCAANGLEIPQSYAEDLPF